MACAGVDILTFGQYLQPTPKHLEVTEFVTPEKFEHWRRYGEEVIGFRCAPKPDVQPLSYYSMAFVAVHARLHFELGGVRWWCPYGDEALPQGRALQIPERMHK